MTSQPQLSTTPATPEAPEAAPHAAASPAGGSEDATTDLITPDRRTGASAEPRLWQKLGGPGRKPLLIGFLGSLIIAIGAVGAGGVLRHDPVLAGTPFVAWRFGHGYNLAVMVTYLGLGLSVWAWIMLGRDVLARRAGGRAVLTTSVLWILPITVSPPLFSRDPYSYLAYGTLALRGYDPYKIGPSVLTGPIPDNVHWFWSDTPAPYGPLFVALAKAVAFVAGENIILGVILFRLVMMSGLVLLVAALPGLCRRLGGRIPVALWLAVANPVMVIHLIGGPHNDLLVVGCLAMGCLLTLNRQHVAGIALVTCAAAVKATAGLALPFLVLVWAARLSGDQRTRIVKAIAAGVSVFVATMAASSVLGGVGLGWIVTVVAPNNIVNWLSLPTGAGEFLYNVINWMFQVGPAWQTPIISVIRILGSVAFLYIAVKQWLAARDGGTDAVRRAGVVLLVFMVLSPAVLPWYYSWGIAVLAAVAWSVRGLQVAVFVTCFLMVATFPSGEVALYAFGYLTIMLALGVLAAVSLRSADPLRLRTPRPHRPVGTATSETAMSGPASGERRPAPPGAQGPGGGGQLAESSEKVG